MSPAFKENKLTSALTLEITVATTDGTEAVHKYDWPTDPESQVNLRRNLTKRVQAGILDRTIGLIQFDRPSVVYNPLHFVRATMAVTGPESRQSEVAEANRRLGFLQDEPGRG